MTDHARTLLILTDAESRLIREQLNPQPGRTNSAGHQQQAFAAFNRGIIRGTEKMAAEFAAAQKAKRKP